MNMNLDLLLKSAFSAGFSLGSKISLQNWLFICVFITLPIIILAIPVFVRADMREKIIMNFKLVLMWITFPLSIALFAIMVALTSFGDTDLQSLDTK